MFVIAVDNNPDDLNILCEAIKAIHPDAVITRFVDPMMAYKYSVANPVDTLYVAVMMKRLGGFKLEKMMRADNPKLSVNFIADDDTYRVKSMQHFANSYATKPITVEKLAAAEAEEW